MNKMLSQFAALNWKLFIVGFAAGFIGIVLTHGGIHVPKNLNPIQNAQSAAVVGK